MQELNQLFDMVYTQIDSSAAYTKYCELVHGKALFQMNMTDISMIDKLLGMLNITKENTVLDLGCGMGGVTEYIYDRTGASILGIDFSEKAINLAAKRVHGKPGIRFLCLNIEQLNVMKEKFDRVIAIDSLMFIQDLHKFIKTLSSNVVPGGKIGILYTQPAMNNEGESSLKPQDTRLGKALKQNFLKYETWDFTDQELMIWEKKAKYSEELKEEFIKENSLELCENCATEAGNMIELIKSGLCKKYLYYIEL